MTLCPAIVRPLAASFISQPTAAHDFQGGENWRYIPYLNGVASASHDAVTLPADFERTFVAAPILDGIASTFYCLCGNNAAWVDGSERGPTLYVRGNGSIQVYIGNGTTAANNTSAASVVTSAKYASITIGRTGDTYYAKYNNTQVVSTNLTGTPSVLNRLGEQAGGNYFNGHILSDTLINHADPSDPASNWHHDFNSPRTDYALASGTSLGAEQSYGYEYWTEGADITVDDTTGVVSFSGSQSNYATSAIRHESGVNWIAPAGFYFVELVVSDSTQGGVQAKVGGAGSGYKGNGTYDFLLEADGLASSSVQCNADGFDGMATVSIRKLPASALRWSNLPEPERFTWLPGGVLLGPKTAPEPTIVVSPWVDNGDGTYSIDGSQTGAVELFYFGLLAIGGRYLCVIDVISRTAGGVRANSGGGTSSYITAVGSHSVDITSASTAFNWQADADFSGVVRPRSLQPLLEPATP